MNKRGQIAIWIILALILVVSIILFFTINKKITISGGSDINPNQYIEKCTSDAVKEATDKILPQGGFVNPKNFKVYNDIKVSYLCENTGNYLPCINQHPLFLNEMKSEVKNYISPKIDACFRNLKAELESKQNTVEIGSGTIEVSLGPGRIYTSIKRKMTITKNEEARRFENYNVENINPLYDLGLVAMEIANQEAKYCYFEYVGYMILYPKYSIYKYALPDSTKIYTIIDKNSKQKLNIAIRSCAIPPGI